MQSFKVGELDADKAFEIAQQFADRYLGEHYQVVFATHVDCSHIHNHYVFNSVSFIDGTKYHADNNEHKVIRDFSDSLCSEYGLSIIEPKDKGLSYIEWLSEKHGKVSWRSIIKGDIDHAISQSLSYGGFLVEMESLGHEIKQGKYLAFRPYGKERFLRCHRLGVGYSVDDIKNRVDENEIFEMVRIKPKQNAIPYPKKYMTSRSLGRTLPDIEKRYWAWQYRLGLVKKHQAPRKVSKYLKKELLKFERYKEQSKFLRENKIETESDFYSFKQSLKETLAELNEKKQPIVQEIRQNQRAFTALKHIHQFRKPYEMYLKGYENMKDEYDKYIKAEQYIQKKGYTTHDLKEFQVGLYNSRAGFAEKIKDIRKQLNICDNIEESMEVMAQKEKLIDQRKQAKELDKAR